MALFLVLPRWAGTRKVKPIWISLKQETVSGSGISWAICQSAPRCRQISMPAPHHSVFLQAGCPSCHPANSVRALKIKQIDLKVAVQQNHFLYLLYRSTCISHHLQLRTGRFCWCKLLLPSCPCWRQPGSKTLDFSSTVLSTLSLYLKSCNNYTKLQNLEKF